MNKPAELPNSDTESEASGATQLGILLKAASDLVDEQFKISERLDAKARNQAAVAAGVFAGVQAGVISLLNGILRPSVTADTSPYVQYLGIAGGAAVVALLATVLMSYKAWRLRPEKSLSVATIRGYVEAARAGKAVVGVNLITAYAQLAEMRQATNALRAASLKRAGWACALTVVVVCAELFLAYLAIVKR